MLFKPLRMANLCSHSVLLYASIQNKQEKVSPGLVCQLQRGICPVHYTAADDLVESMDWGGHMGLTGIIHLITPKTDTLCDEVLEWDVTLQC